MAAVAAQRRPLGALGRMSLVAAIHVAVLFAIARSLGIGAPLETPEPLITDIYKETRPPEDIPPPPEPNLRASQDTQVLPPPDLRTVVFEQDVITELPPEPDFTERTDTGTAVVQPEIIAVRQDPRRPLSKPQYSARRCAFVPS